jgi:outer membrane protein
MHIFIVLIVCINQNLFAAEEYSLEDLYRIALERSEQVGISEQNLIIARRGKDKALSSLLPSVSAFGEYMQYSEDKDVSSGVGSFTIQPKSSSSWGVSIEQSFSLGGKEITNLRISQKSIESSEYDLYTTREAYILRVAESFYDVLQASKAVEIARENVKRLTKYRDDAKIRLQVGEVTKTALLRAEAELSGAQSELIRTENVLNLAKAVLARVVGIEGDFSLKESTNTEGPSTEDTFYSDELEPLSSLKAEAVRERSELKSNHVQKLIAEEQVKYAKGAYWPTFSVEGGYIRRDEDPSSSFFNDESIYGMLRLGFPLFEGGLRKAEVREAEARKKQADLTYNDLQKKINIEVESAYLVLKTQKGTLKSLEDQLKFARENYDAVSRQFTYGLADSIDVIDANTLLLESERQLNRAQYNYKLFLLALKRATGTLLKTVMGREAGVNSQ